MAELYQFRVVLLGVSPVVWRRLLLASETSLFELQEILQLAFDWSGEHLHRFRIHGKDYGTPQWGGIVFDEDARHGEHSILWGLGEEAGSGNLLV